MKRNILIIFMVLCSINIAYPLNTTNMTNITNDNDVTLNNTSTTNETHNISNTLIYVSLSGNDDNDGLTVKTSKRTIQNAVDTVKENGTVYIKSGTYHENLKINKNMSLIGIKGRSVIIDGDFKDSCIIIEENCMVSIEKLTIQRG